MTKYLYALTTSTVTPSHPAIAVATSVKQAISLAKGALERQGMAACATSLRKVEHDLTRGCCFTARLDVEGGSEKCWVRIVRYKANECLY